MRSGRSCLRDDEVLGSQYTRDHRKRRTSDPEGVVAMIVVVGRRASWMRKPPRFVQMKDDMGSRHGTCGRVRPKPWPVLA